jgi:hypothetical protein
MFTYDAVIDAVQTGQKTMINTFVTNETVAKSMVEFVDAQGSYAKKTIKSTADTAAVVAQEMVKSAAELGKFDFAKFSEGVLSTFKDVAKKKAA